MYLTRLLSQYIGFANPRRHANPLVSVEAQNLHNYYMGVDHEDGDIDPIPKNLMKEIRSFAEMKFIKMKSSLFGSQGEKKVAFFFISAELVLPGNRRTASPLRNLFYRSTVVGRRLTFLLCFAKVEFDSSSTKLFKIRGKTNHWICNSNLQGHPPTRTCRWDLQYAYLYVCMCMYI